MLDNVIDINYYAVDKARNSNVKHRPVGLGIMGFQDCLHLMRVPYASKEAVDLPIASMEAVAYYALLGLDRAGGRARTVRHFRGLALASRASCPRTRLALLREERGRLRRRSTRTRAMDWTAVRGTHPAVRHAQLQLPRDRADGDHRQHRRRVGHRSNRHSRTCTSKSNLSGEFTVANEYLVADLEEAEPVGRGHGAPTSSTSTAASRKIDRIPPELRKLVCDGVRDRSQCGWWKRARGARSGSTRRSR